MKMPKMPKMPTMPFGDDFNKMMKQAAGGAGVDDRKNPSIQGAGTIEGGKFESLTIAGSGTVEGDIEAGKVEVSGAGKIEGDLKAGKVEASGSLSVDGSLVADAFVSAGSSSIAGSVKAGRVDWRGSSEVGRDVEAKKFRSSGAFGIEGSLEADEIEIELNGESRVHAIQGEAIRVKAGAAGAGGGRVVVVTQGRGTTVVTGGTISGNASGYAEGGRVGPVSAGSSVSSGGGGESKLEAKTIEGGAVELENTVADLVRGTTVKIGKGCKIGTVEYSESIAVDDQASVKKQTKK
ncbi:MAG: polymer-forming cytoskeletal protein [Betaproteobacteria bacterium]|nr:polymer-forming cytoskeletal protein [Betaproteobacteria bacterium]